MHHFGSSLAKGKRGEDLLSELWPELQRLDGRKGDFTWNGIKVELKTDSYDMAKTKNFFLEVWSDVDKGKPGGPWQALQHGAELFCYFYSNNLTMYIFDTQALVYYLDGLPKDYYQSVKVPNRTWTTVGYKVPREDLKHLYLEVCFDPASIK